MTIGQAITLVYDRELYPGLHPDDQARWAALLLALMRRGRWGIA